MPLFLIERNFAEQLQMDRKVAASILEVCADLGCNWLFSFLSADKKKTYCLFESPNAEVIRENARRLNLPADVVVQVSNLKPEMFT
jgi:hypothetical protein